MICSGDKVQNTTCWVFGGRYLKGYEIQVQCEGCQVSVYLGNVNVYVSVVNISIPIETVMVLPHWNINFAIDSSAYPCSKAEVRRRI